MNVKIIRKKRTVGEVCYMESALYGSECMKPDFVLIVQRLQYLMNDKSTEWGRKLKPV